MNELVLPPVSLPSTARRPAGATIELVPERRGRFGGAWIRRGLAIAAVCLAAAGAAGAYARHRAAQDQAAREETRRQIGALQGELSNLRSKLDAAEKRRTADQARAQATLAAVDKKVAATAADATAHVRELAEKIDKTAERMQRQQAAAVDRTPVGSIARAAPTQAPRVPAKALSGYRLQRVDGGLAFIDFRGFLARVAPGDLLAGAGRVVAIQRRGAGWAVIAERGEIVGPTE